MLKFIFTPIFEIQINEKNSLTPNKISFSYFKHISIFTIFQAYAVQQCQGKSECRIEAKNSIQGVIKERQDPCVGIPKYTQVVWTCGDYDEPANPYLGPNDKDFDVACENKNKQFGPSSAEMVFFILFISKS